ncbi:MAG: hypothetical protein KKA90_02120 [Nanoarchaeota archaeon]|nr:hypothetical protein [Nanoarchaeota archaeon]
MPNRDLFAGVGIVGLVFLLLFPYTNAQFTPVGPQLPTTPTLSPMKAELAFPRSGTVINNYERLFGLNINPSVLPKDTDQVFFMFSPDGVSWFSTDPSYPVQNGTAFGETGYWEADWDTSKLPNGQYYVGFAFGNFPYSPNKCSYDYIPVTVNNTNTTNTTNSSFCACQTMTIKNTGTADIANPLLGRRGVDNTTLGPRDNINMSAPGPYFIMNFFEVDASLVPGSNAALCTEGQTARRTSVYAGHVDYKRNSTSICPYNGTDMCDDAYKKPSKVKEHTPTAIHWIDSPGQPILKKEYLQNYTGYLYQAHFEAHVNPGCQCTWDVVINVSRSGEVVENQVKNVNCG